jgi:glucose/arabinose dehydrogenase
MTTSRFAQAAVAHAAVALLAAASLAASAAAQQDVPRYESGTPIAPQGLAGQPLGEGPWTYKTGEGMDVRVTVYAEGIVYPFAVAFLPDGDALVTTRGGALRIVRDGVLDPEPVPGGPESFWGGVSGDPGAVHGYMDIALHPDFAANSLVYLSYTKPLDDGATTIALGRGRWTGGALEDFEDVYVAGGPNVRGVARIAFGHDGALFLTTAGGDPQTLDNVGGKVLRLTDDGGVPADNPFVGQEGALPEIYTLGHRGALGIAVHPVTGEVWETENGPNGGDEINILRPGANYGWPLVSLGRTYPGPWQAGNGPTHEGFEPPIVYWMPAIAASGLAFYTGAALPAWTGDVFVGGLRYGEIPGTGQLQRILFNQDFEELRREVLLDDLRQRIRDVRQGPDGLLYVVTDQEDGVILRIEPAG